VVVREIVKRVHFGGLMPASRWRRLIKKAGGKGEDDHEVEFN
jgi:hypothetical protein